MAVLPVITPTLLKRRPAAFNHPDWIFELKYDGFRSLAYVADGGCRLASRNRNLFSKFGALCTEICTALGNHGAVIDGEIVCMDDAGVPQFNQLFFGHGVPRFASFDLLWLDGKDLRALPLMERKKELRRLVRGTTILFADHIEHEGVAFFDLICARDLEGIVAKRKDAPYAGGREATTWYKIKNRDYSQMAGRRELFHEMR